MVDNSETSPSWSGPAEPNNRRAYQSPEVKKLGDFRQLTTGTKGGTAIDQNNTKA